MAVRTATEFRGERERLAAGGICVGTVVELDGAAHRTVP